MNNYKFIAMLFISFAGAVIPLSSSAREPVPIVNYDHIAVATRSASAPQIEQVKEAILSAAKAKEWVVAYQPDGKLLVTLNVRNKHTVVAEIAFTANSYSLQYRDSTNMKFSKIPPYRQNNRGINESGYFSSSNIESEADKKPVIHPAYNTWVSELLKAIQLELMKI